MGGDGGVWRGSITPLRGSSCVSCTEFGVLKVTQILMQRPATITTTTTHSRKGIITDVPANCHISTKGPLYVKDFWTPLEIRLFVINSNGGTPYSYSSSSPAVRHALFACLRHGSAQEFINGVAE